MGCRLFKVLTRMYRTQNPTQYPEEKPESTSGSLLTENGGPAIDGTGRLGLATYLPTHRGGAGFCDLRLGRPPTHAADVSERDHLTNGRD